jgi:hypothetical protein
MTRTARPRQFANVAYAHTQKPEWGAALIAWEEEGKRGYKFEDGEVRVFKKGYFDRLQAEDIGAERLARLRASLPASPSDPAQTVVETTASIRLDEQLDYFLREFPDGFVGAAWTARSRGKSDRVAATLRAQTDLEQRRLALLIANNDGGKCVSDLVALLNSTDLVPARELKLLHVLPFRTMADLATCLNDLLWSKQEPILSFAAWVGVLNKAIGTRPSWTLCTTPLALLWPDRHVAVKNTTFAAQAKTSGPALRFDAMPGWAMYERALAMAQTLFDELSRTGTGVRNLLDVSDFIAVTQRPKARGEIMTRRGTPVLAVSP